MIIISNRNPKTQVQETVLTRALRLKMSSLSCFKAKMSIRKKRVSTNRVRRLNSLWHKEAGWEAKKILSTIHRAGVINTPHCQIVPITLKYKYLPLMGQQFKIIIILKITIILQVLKLWHLLEVTVKIQQTNKNQF